MSRQKITASPEFKKNKLKTSKIALKNEKRTDTKTNLVCYCINSFAFNMCHYNKKFFLMFYKLESTFYLI